MFVNDIAYCLLVFKCSAYLYENYKGYKGYNLIASVGLLKKTVEYFTLADVKNEAGKYIISCIFIMKYLTVCPVGN